MAILKMKLSDRFTWKQGRQSSGYSKISLLESMWPIPFDLYLLKFPEGSQIPEHVDTVEEGFRHYRLNIILKKSLSGGEFMAEKSIVNWSRVKFFRPDISKHSVTKVVGGSRYVLSFGFLLKNKVK
jgi:hypothetical protein